MLRVGYSLVNFQSLKIKSIGCPVASKVVKSCLPPPPPFFFFTKKSLTARVVFSSYRFLTRAGLKLTNICYAPRFLLGVTGKHNKGRICSLFSKTL